MRTRVHRWASLRRVGVSLARRIDGPGFVLNVYLWAFVWQVWR